MLATQSNHIIRSPLKSTVYREVNFAFARHWKYTTRGKCDKWLVARCLVIFNKELWVSLPAPPCYAKRRSHLEVLLGCCLGEIALPDGTRQHI